MIVFFIKQNDTSPSIEVQLLDAKEQPVNVSDATVMFYMCDFDCGEKKILAPAEVVDGGQGIVRYDWQPGNTNEPGFYRAEFEVTYTDGTVETFPNDSYITVMVKTELG